MNEISVKCTLLVKMVAEFEASISGYKSSQYEAHEEALNLMKLAARHVSGVVGIARAGYGLLPSAEVASRAAYEASVRAAWMLAPEDPLERECRYLAHLAGEVTYLEKEAREAKAMGIDPTPSEERRDRLRDFSEGVSKLLVARGYSPKGMPPIPDMLKEIGERKTYAVYALLCQTAHGGHFSTWIFRAGGVGTEKVRGEFITDKKWDVPLAIARFAFKGPGLLTLERLGLETSGLRALIDP